jgi:bifunctional non-homologous end joining protein LigD
MAALDELGANGTWEVFGRRLRLTNLDKELFPARGKGRPVRKRRFVGYAAAIAPTVLPYLRGRAVNLHRYPNGAAAKGFWHKQIPTHAPDWITRWDNPDAEPGETSTYVVVEEPATLVWLANFAALEWHPWTSPVTAPDRPSYVLFDIDPGPATTWQQVLDLACLHRDALHHLGVHGAAKVSGRRGIQIWVPIHPGPSFAETREWAHRISRTIGAVVPDLVSWEWDKSSRHGLARLDWTQNAVNKTLVAPWSPRAAPGAPVSVPIDWAELDDRALRPDRWTIETALDRLAEHGDPFQVVLTGPQGLPSL